MKISNLDSAISSIIFMIYFFIKFEKSIFKLVYKKSKSTSIIIEKLKINEKNLDKYSNFFSILYFANFKSNYSLFSIEIAR